MAFSEPLVNDFLSPLVVNIEKIHLLTRQFYSTFLKLAAESTEQFLTTPITESLLIPSPANQKGRYLAIDIGGTNLRVGFIELLDPAQQDEREQLDPCEYGSSIRRQLEKSWPIGEQLKHNNADDLFTWIGKCIAEVVQDGCHKWQDEWPKIIPMGVTFSFPMIQKNLSEAILMSMGKGFAITSNLNLVNQLARGYEAARGPHLPGIKISAIANDAVATLVSFFYQLSTNSQQKAAMSVIVGTGCNATIPLALSKLHESKRLPQLELSPIEGNEMKIAVNTEWTINGTVDPLRVLGFITDWDAKLDAECEAPGFQPLEYMTAGRYLGELGRIIILDYLLAVLNIVEERLPPKIRRRHGLSTSFLGNLNPPGATDVAGNKPSPPTLVSQLQSELPASPEPDAWNWSPEVATLVWRIARLIQQRAAGMIAAAIIGLLACADEIALSSDDRKLDIPQDDAAPSPAPARELIVGYTGGCIVHFQDYLHDCQSFLDQILEREFGAADGHPRPRVILKPCHDGGIIGAGILASNVGRQGQ